MKEPEKNPETPRRPVSHRLLHALAEAVAILIFSGGLVIVGTASLCLTGNACDSTGGILFLIVSLVVTIAVSSALVSKLAKYRERPSARKKLDIAIASMTIILWGVYFYRFA